MTDLIRTLEPVTLDAAANATYERAAAAIGAESYGFVVQRFALADIAAGYIAAGTTQRAASERVASEAAGHGVTVSASRVRQYIAVCARLRENGEAPRDFGTPDRRSASGHVTGGNALSWEAMHGLITDYTRPASKRGTSTLDAVLSSALTRHGAGDLPVADLDAVLATLLDLVTAVQAVD